MLFFNQLLEALKFATSALRGNRLRTLLSLYGITIGIFAIILVYSVVDSLEQSIRKSVNALGDNVVYVQKWPFGGGGDFPWWKYLNRPEPTLRDAETLAKRTTKAEVVIFKYSGSGTAKYASNSVERADLVGVQYGIDKIWTYTISQGRNITEVEFSAARPVAIIGASVAEGLFGEINPIGKRIKIKGTKLLVIGVFERTGKDLIAQSYDEMIMVPATFLTSVINPKYTGGNQIMVKAKPDVNIEELKDDLRGNLRAINRLKPKADDNFSMNEISMLASSLDSLFSVLSIAGTLIGGFSILVGGFGIANIMFVSVKERTTEIGIQKAMGARNSFILTQFLVESIILCLIGGFIGLIFVYFAAKGAARAFEFDIYLSSGNIILGITLSAIIGLVSGFLPAYTASKMEPVDAIRFKQ